jgi:hypothetical protein
MDRRCLGKQLTFSAVGGSVSGVLRGQARVAGVLLAGLLTAAMIPAAGVSAGTAAARGTLTTLRGPGLFSGQILPVEAIAATALSGVYCTSASNCWAVGVQRASGESAALNQMLRWNGSTWRPFPVPQPAGTRRDDYAALASVRCLTAADCWAVGNYSKGGAYFDEALHWNGTKWSLVPTPAPGGMLGNEFSELDDVVCTSHASCWAVGEFGSQNTSANQFLYWNGKRWSVVSAPDPDGTNTDDNNIAEAVRCSAPSSCLVVGYGATSSSQASTGNESLRWNGRKWSVLTTVDPGGTTADSANELTGLACSSSASCWAAGAFGTVSTQTLLNQILHWNGKRWFEVQIPDPDGTSAGDYNELLWDTCVSATDCWAVGSDGQADSATVDLRNQALHWNGTIWSLVSTPDPGSTAQLGANALLGARCTAAANCWAVGVREQGKSLVDQILHWNGKKWSSADKTIVTGPPVQAGR